MKPAMQSQRCRKVSSGGRDDFTTVNSHVIIRNESNSFQAKGIRFFFFSLEEKRMHVHVYCVDGEEKFWLEPAVVLAKNYGLSKKRVGEARKIVQERKDEIKTAWRKHFKS